MLETRVQSPIWEDPRASGQHSLHTAMEAHALYSQRSAKEKPPQREARTPQLESRPRSLQLEKTCARQQTPSTAKNKKINLNQQTGLTDPQTVRPQELWAKVRDLGSGPRWPGRCDFSC